MAIFQQQPLSLLRPDFRHLVDLVTPSAKVLDLGCADGALLEAMVLEKKIRPRGVELSEEGVLACVRRGLSVRQGNLDEGLADYPDEAFDYVILSQTLPYLNGPAAMLKEIVRVGKHGVVSFTNWGFWRYRADLLLNGHFPSSPDVPHAWQSERRWQAYTISDFIELCEANDIAIEREIYLDHDKEISFRPNLFASTAIFVLTS